MGDIYSQEHHRTPQNIFSDIDETVVNIRPKLASLFFTDNDINKPEFKHLFNNGAVNAWEKGPDELANFITSANSYYIEREILTPEGVAYFNDKYKSVGLYLYDKHQDDFYDDLELSMVGKFLKVHSDSIDQLIFMTHHSETAERNSKGRFIAENFPASEIAFIPVNVKKSKILLEVIKELNIKPTAFIDDRPDVLVDILTNTQFDPGFQLGLIAHNYTHYFMDKHNMPIINGLGLVSQLKRYIFKTYAPYGVSFSFT